MLGRTNAGGAGGGLNFKVVGNPQPASPKENTIWIDTNIKITSYFFNGAEPKAPAEGMVWIFVGFSSGVEFNALKKNGIQVYPVSAKQYEGGKWVDKVAYIYQNGEWVDWITYLIKGADLCKGVTGGWTAHAKGWSSSNNVPSMPVVTKNSDSITIQLNATGWACGLYLANNKINLDNIDKISINGFGSDVESGGGSLGLVVFSALGTYANDNYVASVPITTKDKTYELPVAELSGEYVIGVRLLSTNVLAASATIKEIRME